MIDVAQVDRWLAEREDQHLEFKEAKRTFDSDDLVKYCCALANEGGGYLVLGVSPRLPRHVVGSAAFKNLQKIEIDLFNRLHLRIRPIEIGHADGRVVVFDVPSRPRGTPLEVGGTYWMRAGESLIGMSPDELKRIFAEDVPDFSALPCDGATIDDLVQGAIEDFRQKWATKALDARIERMSIDQVLADVELSIDGVPTFAALVLFGTPRSLRRFLPQAELVFEYRSTGSAGPAQHRLDLQSGFFTWYDRLWDAINARNDLQHYREGLFVWDIPTFDEAVVRELMLNAVAHRDYRLPGSIFVRQYARKLEVVSPGGLPDGITLENILYRQAPRNRRVCEALQRCGLVERSGQGMNRIVETCVLQSKALPDFTGTDDYQVSVTVAGVVDDPQFVTMLSTIAEEQLQNFSTPHFLALDAVHRVGKVASDLKDAVDDLLEIGIVERVKRGRYVLSRRMYAALGRKGAYTRRKGLDRDTNQQLLLKHIKENAAAGSTMDELMQVLPSLSRNQIYGMLDRLRNERQVECRGRTKAARWYPLGLRGDDRKPSKSKQTSKQSAHLNEEE